MNSVDLSYEILLPMTGTEMVKWIEKIARICYRSEDKITEDGESAKKLLNTLLSPNPPHTAMIEHMVISVIFTTQRAFTHELVRHRMASYAQESQRYCNYSKNKFGGSINFINPSTYSSYSKKMREMLVNNPDKYRAVLSEFDKAYMASEEAYMNLIAEGVPAEIARDVLPNGTATKIAITANLREWRQIFELRTSDRAHPIMQAFMRDILKQFKTHIPVVFDTVTYESAGEEMDKIQPCINGVVHVHTDNGFVEV